MKILNTFVWILVGYCFICAGCISHAPAQIMEHANSAQERTLLQKGYIEYEKRCMAQISEMQKMYPQYEEQFNNSEMLDILEVFHGEDDENWYLYFFPNTKHPRTILLGKNNEKIYYMWVEVAINKKNGIVECKCELTGEIDEALDLSPAIRQELFTIADSTAKQKDPSITHVGSIRIGRLKFNSDLWMIDLDARRKTLPGPCLGCEDLLFVEKDTKQVILAFIEPLAPAPSKHP